MASLILTPSTILDSFFVQVSFHLSTRPGVVDLPNVAAGDFHPVSLAFSAGVAHITDEMLAPALTQTLACFNVHKIITLTQNRAGAVGAAIFAFKEPDFSSA